MAIRACSFAVILMGLANITPVKASHLAPDLYFVAIGSSKYPAVDPRKNLTWPSMLAPVNSATRVATALADIGANFGILLLSDEKHSISKEDMKKSIIDLKVKIRKDHSIHPIIFFYYIGHGIGDIYRQTLYLVPGNIEMNKIPSQSITSFLSTSMLSNLDIVSSLESFRLPPSMAFEDGFFPSDLFIDPQKPGDFNRVTEIARKLTETDNENREANRYPPGSVPPVPFVALFDNCYDKVEQDLIDLDNKDVESHKNSLSDLLNTFESGIQKSILNDFSIAQSDGLVLYAVAPGKKATDYENPDGGDPAPVGSLARRLLFAFHSTARSTMSLRELSNALDDPRATTYGAATAAFAVDTPIPYHLSSANDAILDNTILPVLSRKRRGSSVEIRFGTAFMDHQ